MSDDGVRIGNWFIEFDEDGLACGMRPVEVRSDDGTWSYPPRETPEAK